MVIQMQDNKAIRSAKKKETKYWGKRHTEKWASITTNLGSDVRNETFEFQQLFLSCDDHLAWIVRRLSVDDLLLFGNALIEDIDGAAVVRHRRVEVAIEPIREPDLVVRLGKTPVVRFKVFG